jgi:hypothetical protein
MTSTAILRNPVSAVPPEWIRLPKPRERCPFSGLSRTTLTELVIPCQANHYRPQVKSVVLKKPGAIRGIRLIHRESLFRYLEGLL